MRPSQTLRSTSASASGIFNGRRHRPNARSVPLSSQHPQLPSPSIFNDPSFSDLRVPRELGFRPMHRTSEVSQHQRWPVVYRFTCTLSKRQLTPVAFRTRSTSTNHSACRASHARGRLPSPVPAFEIRGGGGGSIGHPQRWYIGHTHAFDAEPAGSEVRTGNSRCEPLSSCSCSGGRWWWGTRKTTNYGRYVYIARRRATSVDRAG